MRRLSSVTATGKAPSGQAPQGSAGRAIGSVFPLLEAGTAPAGQPPSNSLWTLWTAARTHVAAYGCARAALSALLAFRGVARVWLPAYACDALAEAAAGLDRRWFDVDDNLEPDLATLNSGLRTGDAVVAIDYFGRPPGRDFIALVSSRPDVLWIEDRAQAIETGAPAWGDVALYSPRKLVGVGDGGVLVGDAPLPPPFGRPPPAPDAQHARAADPLGHRPETWFPAFQAQEREFDTDCGMMSHLTRESLEQAPAEPLIAPRQANARLLAEALPNIALWPDEEYRFAPLAFPVRVADRDALADALANEAIYCAKHWASLPSDPKPFPGPHRLSGEILSLPCDHRYGSADMTRIVEAVRRAGARRVR